VTTISEAPALELREIGGPSAFGGTVRRFMQLLWLVSKTEIRTRYQGAVLGLLWSVLEPLMIFGVLYAVFNTVLRFGGEIPHYPALLLMNIMLYRTVFAGTTARAVSCVVSREGLVRKTQFPRIVIPLSVVLTGSLLFVGDLVVLMCFMLINGVQPMWTWLLFPVIVLALTMMTTGMALLLSTLYVRFRDTMQLWGAVSLILFYASPVIFPVERVPEGGLRTALFLLNPFVPLLEQARIWMIQPTAPAISSVAPGPLHGLLIPSLVFVAICAGGLWAFVRQAPKVAEEL
jgi:ABC-2 type transport system permease protein